MSAPGSRVRAPLIFTALFSISSREGLKRPPFVKHLLSQALFWVLMYIVSFNYHNNLMTLIFFSLELRKLKDTRLKKLPKSQL